MSDPINPPHYKDHPSGIECIDVVEHMNFNLGNAVKYVWRAGLKGDAVEDLEKAIWYLRREVTRLKAGSSAAVVERYRDVVRKIESGEISTYDALVALRAARAGEAV